MSYNNILDILLAKQVSQNTLDSFNILVKQQNKIYGKYDSAWLSYFSKLYQDTLIFPVFSLYGGLNGFIYRTLELKSFFDKSFNTKSSSQLFGLHITYPKISYLDFVYVVEGLFDFLTLYDRGIRNIVSSFGAKLSIDQACLIARFAKSAIICYDNDPAGINGSMKATNLLKSIGIHAHSVNVGQDPDDFVRDHGIASFTQICLDQLNLKII